jgi:hypothetical protein
LSSNGDNIVVAVQLAKGAAEGMMRWEGDVRNLEVAWNQLCYGSMPPVLLQIALFMKKWPGGTLHRVLAVDDAAAERRHGERGRGAPAPQHVPAFHCTQWRRQVQPQPRL